MAVDLSARKYCSASIMLGKTAEVTHDYEIAEAWTAAALIRKGLLLGKTITVSRINTDRYRGR